MSVQLKINQITQQHSCLQSIFESLIQSKNRTGITKNQFKILQVIQEIIDDNQECAMQTIATKLNSSLPALTQSINRMTSLKLVIRQNSSADRRKIILEITSLGTAKLQDYLIVKQEISTQIFGVLSKLELDIMIDLYQKLTLNK